MRQGHSRIVTRVSFLSSAYLIVFFTISTILFVASLFVSCTADESTTEFTEERDAVIRFEINADTPKDATTRSVNEYQINDLHVLVYNSAGELTGKSYTTFSGTTYTVSVLARSGTGCKIYAIANTASPILFDGAVASTEAKLKAMTTNLASWNTFNNTSGTVYLPMCGSTTADIAPGSTSLQGGISVKRLVAKVSLGVGIASGSGITISGYRIYGIPGRSYYVAHPLSTEDQTTDTQTTRAEDASLPANAANWMNSGLVSLANVTSFNVDFYTYENRAGINTAITAQNQKIKTNVPATPADSAAYIMIYGKGGGYTSLSWKIYLGADNTTNFNLKRNSVYTCTVTLKANSSDMRVTYSPKLIWAGSNIYWNGTKLTFDPASVDPMNPTTQELSNMKKQGVAFRWGSLVGVSISETYTTYTPTYNSSSPSASTWDVGSATFTGIPYFTDNVSDGGQTNAFINNAAQNTDANYSALKGDICKYLSKTGVVSGNWRMPTAKEYNVGGVPDATSVSWTTTSIPWARFGTFATNTATPDGQTLIPSGGTYVSNGCTSNFPVPGIRYTDGALGVTGQFGNYWTSSASASSNAYTLYFDESYLYPANIRSRQYAFVVRCVKD